MGDWPPERKITLDASLIYLWTIPEQPPGTSGD
jgi:hypothetical protein